MGMLKKSGNPCSFPVGTTVTWNSRAPKTWCFVHTPGPMVVVDAQWHDGTPSELLQTFVDMFPSKRPARRPGWILTIEYDADSTDYYDPPLSLLLGEKRVTKDVHEMWLKRVRHAQTEDIQ